MSADYAPYEYHALIDGEDKIIGFDVDIAQAIADDIMDRAKDLNNGIVKDDMTVLVARIFPI